MAYSDAPNPRWDRIAGFIVWLFTGFVLIDALSGVFISNCTSEPCNPSLGWRVAALVVAAYALSAVIGWSATTIIGRLIYRRAD